MTLFEQNVVNNYRCQLNGLCHSTIGTFVTRRRNAANSFLQTFFSPMLNFDFLSSMIEHSVTIGLLQLSIAMLIVILDINFHDVTIVI